MEKKDSSALGTLNDTLELYLVKKAPRLPEKWQDVIVKYLPWLTLIFFIIKLPLILVLFGLGTVIAPFAYLGGASFGLNYTFGLIVLAISLVLEAMAIPGLFKNLRSAWNLLYYASLINFLYNIVNLDIVGGIIGTVISLYFLFQIRNHYH